MEHFDVVIIGAGLSGIGAGCHLKLHCPEKRFLILESREALGGTWDLFRYPGIRSDSDMHTLGFSFKPWKADKAIADGPSILEYMHETVEEYDLGKHIRYQQVLRSASWSSEDERWTLEIDGPEGGSVSCNFLYMCCGYYSYEKGHAPDFEGLDRFQGKLIYPQFWPEDFDYSGRRVAVIGSGATAMTLVPSMAKDAAHVTMVQRSPTYVVARPDKDAIANQRSGSSQRAAREADQILMERVAQGDAQAFQQLMDSGIDRVFSIARRMLGNEAEAEDVAQEVFLRLWRQADKWEGARAQVSTWLYRVTVNSCIDRMRGRREDTVEELPEQTGEATQQHTLEETDLQSYVEKALQKLPERQRAALVMFHYENLSMNDVAESMEISVDAVESLLARGRRSLKKSLNSQWKSFLPDMTE